MNADRTVDRAPIDHHDARAHVSAFIDGELADADVERVIDALLASDDLADFWADAHRAGDWMRSDEVIGVGNGGFLRRFAAQLAVEPAIVAPQRNGRSRSRRFWIRTGLPGASVAAALLVVAWVASPLVGDSKRAGGSATAVPSLAIVQTSADDASIRQTEFRTVEPDRLADYLAAHRDVTPFAYRGAAAVRPAAFTGQSVDASPSADR